MKPTDSMTGGHDTGTRAKILAAAQKIIGREGIKSLTTRRLAEMAGVNVAALNYHFKNKEALIEEALMSFFTDLQSYFASLDGLTEENFQDRLCGFLLDYTDHFLEYPGIFISQVHYLLDSILTGHFETKDPAPATVPVLLKIIQGGIGIFTRIISGLTQWKDEKTAAMKIVQIMTSVTHPILLSPVISSRRGINYANRAEREVYIRNVISTVLG